MSVDEPTSGRKPSYATVVEGVERRSQLELLPGFGADLVQGFLLAGPEPPEAAVARLSPGP